MEPEPRLKIRLIRGWKPLESPEAVATYYREGSLESGALQFSTAQYKSGSLPNTTEEQLIEICWNLAANIRGGQITSTRSGSCDFGVFGTVVVSAHDPIHFQAWVVSNRRDFILVTHTCMNEPDAAEVSEANEIALMTRMG